MIFNYKNRYLGNLKLKTCDNNSKADFEYFREAFCDPNIMNTFAIFNRTIANSEQRITFLFDMFTSKNKKNKQAVNKIIDQNNNFIGIIGLYNIKENDGLTFKIVYALKKQYRNKRIVSEASEIIIDDAFKKYKYLKIIGDNLVENVISQKIMLKLGFKFKGKFLNRNGTEVNIFILEKEDFYSRNKIKHDFDKELEHIKNYPSDDKYVDDYIV